MRKGTCERCGTPFLTTNPIKRYCIERCRKRDETKRREQRSGRRPNRPSFTLLKPTSARVTDNDLARYYEAQAGDPCAYCGAPSEHVDHIVPSGQGGANDWTNYTAACATCNARKGNTPLLAFLIRRPLLEQQAALRQQLEEWNAMTPITHRTTKQKASGGARRARRRLQGVGEDPIERGAHAVTGLSARKTLQESGRGR